MDLERWILTVRTTLQKKANKNIEDISFAEFMEMMTG